MIQRLCDFFKGKTILFTAIDCDLQTKGFVIFFSGQDQRDPDGDLRGFLLRHFEDEVVPPGSDRGATAATASSNSDHECFSAGHVKGQCQC